MRKKSTYSPRPVLVNPLAYVLESISPMTSTGMDDVVLRTRSRLAYVALTKGTATASDMRDLAALSNMAQALKKQGKGTDWADELYEGACAVEAVIKRKNAGTSARYVGWAQEYAAIALLMDIHDAQLDSTTVGEICNGAAMVRNKVKNLPNLISAP